jgi:hypothetical protein
MSFVMIDHHRYMSYHRDEVGQEAYIFDLTMPCSSCFIPLVCGLTSNGVRQGASVRSQQGLLIA